MQLRYLDADPLTHETPLLAVGVIQGTEAPSGVLARLDETLGGVIARTMRTGDMKGRKTDELLLYGGDSGRGTSGPRRIILLGLGKAADLDGEALRRMSARGVRAAERLGLESLAIWIPPLDALGDAERAQAAAEGAALAAWRFRELKGKPGTADEDEPATEVTSVDVMGEGDGETLAAGTMTGAAIARGENLARTLQSRPGNVATPTHIADEAVRVAGSVGLEVRVYDEAALREEGMHAILAVSRGSHEEARLIVMEHRGGAEGEAPLILVGKGLSFDAGGISLKPPGGMEQMKFDMSGGAAVIGAMQAIGELGVRANVVGIVPSSENLPSGTALKPGDVIRSLAGKTIEVVNTDAEGRLILADALTYATRMKPAAIVDCATLTGAVAVALGNQAAAVLGNDDGLVGELIEAGEASGERCWQLPLWDEYKKQLESDVADLQNVGGRPAGTITAACFLSEFVGDAKWAHLDIAATAYGEGKLPYQRTGGHGFPTRLLVQWVRSRSA
jgi:leucyl aminopeptidase